MPTIFMYTVKFLLDVANELIMCAKYGNKIIINNLFSISFNLFNFLTL